MKKEIIINFGGWPGAICDIAQDIVDRIDVNELEDYPDDWWSILDDAANDALIYTDDEWEIMKYYCTPETADYADAYDNFITDLAGSVELLIEEDEEEEEDEDDD